MHFSDNGVSVVGPLKEDDVIDVWPKIEGYLAMALDRDDWKVNPDDLIKQIAEGLIGLYVFSVDDTGEILAAVACEVQEYPNADVFNIAYCGGKDLYRWANLICAFEFEAARLGCQTVRITGRAGWGKIFPDYREMHRVFERKVLVAQ